MQRKRYPPPIVYILSTLLLALVGKPVANWTLQVIFPQSTAVSTPSSTDSTASQLLTRFSAGERQLIGAVTTPAKQTGIESFAAEEYLKAADWLEVSLQDHANDPEARIYLNNARLRAERRKTYTIVVSVPIGNNLNIAQEILRGVAQAQDEINQAGGINGVGLSVTIIDDDNDPTITPQIAEIVVKDRNILAFVGHNAGDASLAAAPVYQQHGLVMISPTTFNSEVTKIGNYIFRAIPTVQSMAAPLVEHMLERLPQPRILVCYDSTAPDQSAYKNAFVDILTSKGGEVVRVFDHQGRDRCDYSVDSFNANVVIAEAIAQGANGIFLGTNVNNFDPTLAVIHTNNNRLPLFSSPTLYTQKIIQQGQQSVDGLVLVAPWNPDVHLQFAQSARNLWNATVNWRTATAYDATRAIIAGLQQNNTRAGLQQALQDHTFSTSGSGDPVRFLETRDRHLTPILTQIQSDGSGNYRFVAIE